MGATRTAEDHSHPNYEIVFGILILLVFAKVMIAQLDLTPAVNLSLLSVLGLGKAAIVAAFFMHLKYETWKLISFVATPVACTVLLVGYLMVDATYGPWSVILPSVGFVVLLGLIVAYFLWTRVVENQ